MDDKEKPSWGICLDKGISSVNVASLVLGLMIPMSTYYLRLELWINKLKGCQ